MGQYELNESFLETVGLSELPEDKKRLFLAEFQDELDIKRGEKMSASLSDDQLTELEKLIDDDRDFIKKWLDMSGDYKNDEVYKKILKTHGAETPEMLKDFATAKWLEKNCPKYGDYIAEVFKEMTDDIMKRRDIILWQYS